jgi:hypothetical protein
MVTVVALKGMKADPLPDVSLGDDFDELSKTYSCNDFP